MKKTDKVAVDLIEPVLRYLMRTGDSLEEHLAPCTVNMIQLLHRVEPNLDRDAIQTELAGRCKTVAAKTEVTPPAETAKPRTKKPKLDLSKNSIDDSIESS